VYPKDDDRPEAWWGLLPHPGKGEGAEEVMGRLNSRRLLEDPILGMVDDVGAKNDLLSRWWRKGMMWKMAYR